MYATALVAALLSGWGQLQPPSSEHESVLVSKIIKREACDRLKRPEYVSFKQAAYSVVQREGIAMGEIVDLHFFDKKFTSSAYHSVPELKIDLEGKHNVFINTVVIV